MTFPDYYSVLSVGPTATNIDIKQAYRSLARQLHPDVNASETATAEMQQLNEAYLVLSNVETRSRYDHEYKNYNAWTSAEHADAQSEYTFKDDELKNRVNQAAKKARSMGRQIIDDGIELLGVAGKEAVKSTLFYSLVYGLGGLLLFFLILAQVRCQH